MQLDPFAALALELQEIAKKHLGIPTLDARHSDELDFYDLSVWSILAALEEAYSAGQRAAHAPGQQQKQPVLGSEEGA